MGVIKTNFLGNDVRKENMQYTCIAGITIDSVMRMEKKNFPQVYSEECKYKIKIIKMLIFINTELDSDSESESESNAELMAKLKSDSDNDKIFWWNINAHKWLQMITNKNDSHK